MKPSLAISIKTIRLSLLPAFVLLTIISCAQRVMRAPKQGVTGLILEVRGNQMPAIGRPQFKGRGVSREVVFFAPTTAAQTVGGPTLFSTVKTKQVATTRSDSAGRYQVALPPGKYSVFVKDDGQFFASEADDNGVLCPVEVQPNTLTHKDISLNNRAVY